MSKKFFGRLCGKIAIVTGSTAGIGFSIAERLAEEGAKVIISSRKSQNVDAALTKLLDKNLSVKGLVCHVSQANERKTLFTEASKWGGLDILISNVGVNPKIGPILDCTEEVWDKSFNVNVKASYLLAKEALPLLRKSKGGRIIFISSICGLQPYEFLGVYSVTKCALLGLTKAAALQLAVEEITVNSVCPGIIRTKFSNVLTSENNLEEETLSRIPLTRLGEPEDVSAIVAFLASEEASYITGENFVIAGGMSSRL